MADGSLRGLARGLAYRLIEAGGLIDRGPVAAEVRSLSQAERRTLRSLGVRFGAFSLSMPGLQEPAARGLAGAFAGVEQPAWTPPADRPSRLPDPPPAPRVLAARGLRACGPYAVPAEDLERLDALLRAAPRQAGGVVLSDQALESLGWTGPVADAVLRALGYAPARKPEPGAPALWRRRGEPRPPASPAVRPDSPFAALAALARPKPAPSRKPRRRRRPARPAGAA